MMTYQELRTLLELNRTYRRFDESKRIGSDTLRSLVELTRYCASGRNAQPLKYRLVTSNEECSQVFPTLAWAGYYQDWYGPEEGERPVAYLVQCLDTRYGENCLCDDGLQLEAITLGAVTLGLGCCIIKSFNAKKISELLSLPEGMVPRYVVAIGVPAEKVYIEEMDGTPLASFKYYRDSEGGHHVPKRPLEELIIG